MEILGGLIMFVGGLLAFAAYIWLVVVAFKEGGAIWGIVVLLFSGLGGLIFCIVNKTGWLPWIVMVLGGILASFGVVPMALSNMESF